MPTIKIKGSSTAAAEPLTLAERELAVNVTDKKLYVGDGAAVRKIVGSLGNQEASAVAITGGSIAGITDLAVADGGTGASTAADARTNLGITATGADTTYAFRSNNLSDLASASTARTNLGLGSIATQASSSVSITGGSITGVTDIAIADGGTGASTAADARTNLGLGSIATQSASSVSITGGTISGITDLAVADGGTGASTAADARTNLSVPSTTGSGASGTWDISITGNAATATSATSATTATNLAGGAANRVPYQSASGTTTFVAAPTVTNSYLKWNGTSLGWDTVSGGGGGGGTPGGSNTQVQFNDGGSFGGDAGLTYDKTTDVLTVAGSFNGPVGATTANTGAFTTLSASSTVSGAGFSTYLASPPAIGGTAAAAGSFTTLSASSTVSGTGFSTYLASPPAIGGTAAAAGTFTTLTANGNTTLGDATSDTITATARLASDLVPSTNNARDLGTSALAYRSVYAATSFVEAGYNVVTQTDIGTAPNEIPLNQYLGSMAYQDGDTSDITVYGVRVGRGAGAVSTNTAVGASALNANTTGATNTALGYQSLQANTTASSNTAVGYQAGYSNTTGAGNTVAGYQAGYSGTTAGQNTLIGRGAGNSITTGGYNTMLGYAAGNVLTTGTINTFIGQSSGELVTTGSKNTILGSYTGNQGGLDIRTSSNYIVLSDGDGNPRAYWDGDGRFIMRWATAKRSYFYNTDATAGNCYGINIQYNNATPNNATNEFLYCDDATMLRASIRSNGGFANYQGNDANLSDRREKTNFAPAKDYLDTICAIPVQTFNYIDQSEDDPGLTLGVVAQDVQAVAPELVTESNWGTKDDPKMRLSIYQTDLQYALMKCIQELKSELDSVKAELATLKGA